MSYKQTVGFDISKGGSRKGYCLQNVRTGYGIGPKYADATTAWEKSNTKHWGDDFPSGVAVPVFAEWYGTIDGVRANYGHVWVSLGDGRMWSDGKVYANLDEFYKAHGNCKPLYGWTEDLNGATVIEWVNDPTPPTPPVDNTPQIGDLVTTNATHDAQSGITLNLSIINDGKSVFSEINSRGNAVLRKDGIARCAVRADSLRKV